MRTNHTKWEYFQLIYQQVNSKELLKESHGAEILRVLAIEWLDQLGILSQQNISILMSEKFMAFIMRKAIPHQVSIEIFYQYITFLYLRSNLAIFLEQIEDFMNCNLIEQFINQYIMLQENISIFQTQSLNSSEAVKGWKSKFKVKILTEITDSKIKSNEKENNSQNSTISSTFSDYQNDKKVTDKQVKPLHNKNELINYEWNSRFSKQLQKERQDYLYEMMKQNDQSVNSISEIIQLKESCGVLNFEESDVQLQNKQFIYIYKSDELKIPEIRSDPKPSKKEAKHCAAKKFISHLKFYLRYRTPFFFTQDQEFNYFLEIEKKKNCQILSGFDSIQNYQEDQKLATDYNDEISKVYLAIQQNEHNNGWNNIKFEIQNQTLGLYCCKVVFTFKENQLFITEGSAISKRKSKEIAFQKIFPLIINFYNKMDNLKLQNQNKPKDNKNIKYPMITLLAQKKQLNVNPMYYQHQMKSSSFIEHFSPLINSIQNKNQTNPKQGKKPLQLKVPVSLILR